jgi:hypothetical protein
MRKGHGTEVFRDGSYSGFSLSLLIDCCDSDCKFEFKPLCVLFLFCCFEKHEIIICKVILIILQIVGIALAVVIMPNKAIVMRGFKGTMSTTMHCALKQCSNNNIGRVIHVLVFNPSYISTILWLYLLILTEL